MLYDVIVIGGGASGMMAAITAAQQNKAVLLLESSDRVGRKLLATGNGRCNFTHSNISVDDYYTDNREMLNSVLQKYPSESIISLFEAMGMMAKNLNDYIYPFSESASTVLDVLRIQLQELNCYIKTECDVTEINENNHIFSVSGKHFCYESKSVIVAAGSKAGGFYKGNQNMYQLLKPFRHRCTKLYPALTKCHCREDFFKALAGVRAKANIHVYIDNQFLVSEFGEVQFTKTGISGIPVFQLSGSIAQHLSEKKKVTVSIDFIPDCKKSSLEIIKERLPIMKSCTVEQFFTGFLHKKLMSLFIKMAGLKEQDTVSQYSVKQLQKVIEILRDFKTQISDVEGLENAQVCRGGIPLSECTDDFMSIYQNGLFMCGELLNVDGICGGYNLHFAWASGHICGLAAANYVTKHQGETSA
ncbi:MAG: aminoacetone oxidase family FAD-binding enzyme [Lachnospiraceae bacterium]|nr:aminoacetone oxidase family FAD-binding enzyme [Lachnospiraceae bacterium]